MRNLEWRLSQLERSLSNSLSSQNILDRIKDLEKRVLDFESSEVTKGDIIAIRKEILEMKPSSDTRVIQYQGLKIYSLKDMKDWLEENISSMNYSLIVDFHTICKIIYYQINPSKTSLEFFQLIYKLKIDTLSHALAIQSFDGSLPKYFCKSRDYRVTKVNESLFDNISSFDDWDDPNSGYRKRFEDKLDSTELTVESAIYEDTSLSDAGRALVTIALSNTV